MKFDSYHPMINLIYFVAVISGTIIFKNPIFVGISFICSFIYSVCLKGIKGIITNIIIIVAMVIFIYYYISFTHFGVTVLEQNFIDNNITLESIIYGTIIALIAGSIAMWFSCIHKIMTTDKFIYLLGRICPKFSLFVSIIFRTIPRIKKRSTKINLAQKCIGRSYSQGNILLRIKNFFRFLSVLITWTLDDFVQTSDSMKNRGYTLKGRTSFSIYRFDNRDRIFVITMCWLIIVLFFGHILDQTTTLYDPQIILTPITFVSYIFYFAYALLCFMPIIVSKFRH